MSDSKPEILLIHPKPHFRRDLAKQIESWCVGAFGVVTAANAGDAMAAMNDMPKGSLELVISARIEHLDLIMAKRGWAALAVMSNEVPDTAEVFTLPLPPSREDLEDLFASWGSARRSEAFAVRRAVTVHRGTASTAQVRALKRLFFLNAITCNWEADGGEELTVMVDGRAVRPSPAS
ncbi:hypothetical protein, partial [Streptomyces sp. CB01881]|uniref:hypothetical protein n=1 Tax=Streptomyces sp. CB01881 TaxID=2078691 RepID=UPI0018848128